MLKFFFYSDHAIADMKLTAPWVGVDFNDKNCDGSGQFHGPYDYTNNLHRKSHLPIVEQYHFTYETHHLLREKQGTAQGSIDYGGIMYTLRSFPNHHNALMTMLNYQKIFQFEIQSGKMGSITPAPECYFQRAINFSKKDVITMVIYARYLSEKNRNNEADLIFRHALNISPENSVVHYNYGIFLYNAKEFNSSLKHAELAKQYGHPGKSLLEKLDKVKP